MALMLGACENPPQAEVLKSLGTTMEELRLESTTGTLSREPTEEPESSVYGSGEEAESAGKQRVQGSRSGGQGFPNATVSSAWNGDGVVCEG